MSVHWIVETPPVRFVKWAAPGDTVKGRLIAYQPHHGAQNYERTQDVGCVVLAQPDGSWLKVALDKGQLATVVDLAHMALVHSMDERPDGAHPVMAIRYEETNGDHKVFRVRCGWECE